LINWSNLSSVSLKIYPNTVPKKKMWEEMVINTLGIRTGKIKVVIADACFFAYQNYLYSPHYHIPVIKSKTHLEVEVMKKIEGIPASSLWWDSRYAGMLQTLLEEFHEIIKLTTSYVQDYRNFQEKRSLIEKFFKTAKHIFGMKDLHTYFTDVAIWKVYIHLYLASLFLQYLQFYNINIDCANELFQQKQGLT
jgi:hypothetical protein